MEYNVDGRYMMVKIPKSAFGLEGDDFTVNFSWTDNVHDEGDYTKYSGDIMDFYISGDVAPGARFKYSYISGTAAQEESSEQQTVAPEGGETTAEGLSEQVTDPAEQKKGCKAFAAGAAVLATAAAAAVVLKKKKD